MKVSSTEFQQNVGLYQKTALTQPVIITSYGRSQTVLISAAVFEVLSRGRIAERMEDLDEGPSCRRGALAFALRWQKSIRGMTDRRLLTCSLQKQLRPFLSLRRTLE